MGMITIITEKDQEITTLILSKFEPWQKALYEDERWRNKYERMLEHHLAEYRAATLVLAKTHQRYELIYDEKGISTGYALFLPRKRTLD